MEKNDGSKSSICRKIREALATRPAETPVTVDSNFPSSSPMHAAKPKPALKTETHLPQHHVSMQVTPPTKAGGHGGKADPSGGMALEQHHGRKDNDFSDFIAKARAKLRVISNIGRGHSNHAPEEAEVNKKNDNHRDKFSSFIHRGRKRIRTTSGVGKTGPWKRG